MDENLPVSVAECRSDLAPSRRQSALAVSRVAACDPAMIEQRAEAMSARSFSAKERADPIGQASGMWEASDLYFASFFLFETLLALGFWSAGLAPAWIPTILASLTAAMLGLIGWSYFGGAGLGPGRARLHLLMQLTAVGLAVGLAIVAPQLALQAFAALFAANLACFIAPDRTRLLVIAGLSILGAMTATLIVGAEFDMATATPIELALTAAVLVIALARCLAVASYVGDLRTRIAGANQSLKEARQRIEILTTCDELTGLPNRRAILRQLCDQIALAERTSLPVSAALLSIDHFKRINEQFGYVAGDGVLRMFAVRASAALRETDCIGRYNGEEFLVVLSATSAQDAIDALRRIRRSISRGDWRSINPGLHVTATIGIAERRAGEMVEHLLTRADAALCTGKLSGRNRVVIDSGPVCEFNSDPCSHPLGTVGSKAIVSER
ncbi:MAG: GGDEF domain-containing protein [Hyphomonadaceae bacterium]|nr:GGDEF domain-containing protein [Hyphomonadaceae bacterium]